ncbi:MAG: class I SAM-dependent methyltransferase [Anaerolineales bacterium]|nr:class I SAM-dependent methyltransferase [Anaerolineales bacterium]
MNEFDRKAREWDLEPARLERARAVAAGIRSSVPLSPRMTAMEYGCGTGLVSFELRQELGKITLADSSAGMLDVVRDKIAAAGADNMQARQLDLLSEPLPPDRQDLLYSLLALHHIQDIDRILEQFYLLLNPKGWLCIADLDKEDGSFHTDPFDGHTGFDRAGLSHRLETIGFGEVVSSTIYRIMKERDGKLKTYPLFLMTTQKM